MRLRFAEFELDPAARELRRNGKAVALGPRALELLMLLARERPRAVSKDELRRRLWPGTFVSSTSLAQLVTELRKALGDSRREPRFVRTVFGFGYGFCAAPVEEAGTPPAPAGPGPSAPTRFLLLWQGRRVPLPQGETVLGRGEECGLLLPTEKASRRHARVSVDGELLEIEDLGSKNGTAVDGRRIDGRTRLRGGNVVTIGGETLLVVAVSGSGTTATEQSEEPAG